MSRKILFVAALLVLWAAALLFRVVSINNRPVHADESVHALKFSQLWLKGVYKYDPNQFHGPTIYYAALPIVWAEGRINFADTHISDFRLSIALFGAGMILLLFFLSDALGKPATLLTGLLLAISPAFVFYSRYYIQEIVLVFFTLALLACIWRFVASRKPVWFLWGGFCVGMMAATKETVVINLFALAVAICTLYLHSRYVEKKPIDWRSGIKLSYLIGAVIIAFFVMAFFITGNFRNPVGFWDYFLAYIPWVHRAHASALHLHPWGYYLHILVWWHNGKGPVWTELLTIILSLIGLIIAFIPQWSDRLDIHPRFIRFVGLYTVILTLVYSTIPYKTPWCLLNFLLGMIIMAGYGGVAMVRLLPGAPLKVIATLLIFGGSLQLAMQSYATSFKYEADTRNPYVYAQTDPDFLRFVKRFRAITAAYPYGNQTLVKVIWKDNYYWPIPWYLRAYKNVGYWGGVIPPDPSAPIVISSYDLDDVMTAKISNTHLMTGLYAIRPGVYLELWVRMDVWKDYLKTLKPGDDGN